MMVQARNTSTSSVSSAAGSECGAAVARASYPIAAPSLGRFDAVLSGFRSWPMSHVLHASRKDSAGHFVNDRAPRRPRRAKADSAQLKLDL